MRVKGMLSLGGAIVAAVLLVSASGAGTTKTRTATHIDLSSRAAIVHYLRSIRVNPTGLVIQRGVRNYAGPGCPGSGWTCTSTTHPVVQIATGAGKNSFECATARCAVVQSASAAVIPNTATCIRTTGITQSCAISQTSSSADNKAMVVETATKVSGLTQSGVQTAQIVQQANGGSNTACVLQTMTIDGSTVAKRGSTVNVTLDAHQSISIAQDSATGDNLVENANPDGTCDGDTLTQSHTINSIANGSGSITQAENAAPNGPNALLDIEQNQSAGFLGSATGTNTSKFAQSSCLTATAFTPTGSVIQTQSSAGGGVTATVNQFSHGVSTSSASQSETQREHAQTATSTTSNTCSTAASGGSLPANTTQTQFGPVHCCSNSADNLNNSFTVDQDATQSNDTHSGQSNDVQAKCTTTGNCTATQGTDIDGAKSSNFQSGQNVTAQTSCTGSTCTTTGGQSGGQLSFPNTDVKEFGFGGMRGTGTGSITVSGVTGTVTRALLYWNGPTNSSDPTANASVNFGGSPVTGTNIGFSSPNCWGFANSQSYRADVTSVVTGDGTYSLSNFDKPPDVEINGVALFVFYDDGNTANDRNVVLWNGNDSNVASSFDGQGWDQTITGVPYPGAGSASLDFVVSDGQAATDDALVLNGSTLVPTGAIFEGDSTPAGPFIPNPPGSLWDVKSFDITSFLSTGSNDLHLTTGLASDCLSLVVAAANVPASAPVIASPASAAAQHSSGPQFQAAHAPALRSAHALPSARRSGTRARTAQSLRPLGRSGEGLVRTQGSLQPGR